MSKIDSKISGVTSLGRAGNRAADGQLAGASPAAGCKVTEALQRVAAAEMVLVSDGEDRENEADLVIAAELCTPEQMAFIIRHGCGIVCVALSREIASRLELPAMAAVNDAPLATAFTVSVDARKGLATGISAAERCMTAQELANPAAIAGDFVRPGHMFPLIARDGGVLERTGHTEAAVDMCRLAGLQPVGVICELFNDDGTVMKGAQISDFARRHGLASVTIEELIDWRRASEIHAALSPASNIGARAIPA